MNRLLIAAVALTMIGMLFQGTSGAVTPAAQLDASRATRQAPTGGRSGGLQTFETLTNFAVSGLPAGLVPRLYIDEPAPGGGYFRIRPVGQALDGVVTLGDGQYLEAAPIPISDTERFIATTRFQPSVGGTTLTFAFQHQYLVVVSRESHGAYDPAIVGRSAGSTSGETQWIAAGSVFSLTASPEGRYQFAQWSTRPLGAADVGSAKISKASTLKVLVDKPLHLVATFVGQ